MFKFIKKLFNPTQETKIEAPKTIKELQIFDDVWVLDDGEIYKGWIYDISRRCITVVYAEDLRDFRFQIPRPLTLTQIEQGDKILYCNKPE